ncbi:MAG: ABC transporter permease [Christensenellales bacterium]|jgi:osmoprotectant transport system permease protein
MYFDQILSALLAHLQITFLGVLLACAVGIPLGSLLKDYKRLSRVVLALVDIIQTVPTLAMLTFIMLVFGLNDTTVIAAIFLYSLFPIMRNTYTGITSVDKGIIRAGRGIGMTELQIYAKVQLPIALPVILSGVRLAIITALGIATTGVLIGAGGLGMLVWRGIQTRNTVMMLSGAIPVSLLAVLFDTFLSFFEKKLGKKVV